jgi:hypothetical protein|mmetsp:Transcript_65509/g.102276  ORF Transcript_65509/g.102276 Transcript_65509/m.102276 type:complete len:435 (-) Transcript_65509:62-1366(-)
MEKTSSAPSEYLEEGVPLLKSSQNVADEAREKGYASTVFSSWSFKKDNVDHKDKTSPLFQIDNNEKLVSYDTDSLLTARALTAIGKSAFAQTPVIMTLTYCVSIAVICGGITFFIPRASLFDTHRFNTFSIFLKFFISFMLGMYVQQAFKRWWFSVSTFEKFLIAIRQMVFMLHTVRGKPEWRVMIERYSLASGYILSAEVRNAQMVEASRHVSMKKLLDWLVDKEYIADEERHQLDTCHNGVLAKTRAVWAWIGELVSHPVTDDDAGMVAAPLLVRTIVLCQDCISEIENLKMNITMQMPFMYAQLLSILVHINNTILAGSCGMAVGSAFNEINRRSEQLSGERPYHRREIEVVGQMYQAIQVTGVQITILLITPMLYVAFLHIAHLLCYPFGDESYHLPTETFIARLHSELKSMSDNRKYFAGKHLEWKERI